MLTCNLLAVANLLVIVLHATLVICVNEVEAHPFFSNSKLIEFSQRNGIQVTAFSPLAKPARPWYALFVYSCDS